MIFVVMMSTTYQGIFEGAVPTHSGRPRRLAQPPLSSGGVLQMQEYGFDRLGPAGASGQRAVLIPDWDPESRRRYYWPLHPPQPITQERQRWRHIDYPLGSAGRHDGVPEGVQDLLQRATEVELPKLLPCSSSAEGWSVYRPGNWVAYSAVAYSGRRWTLCLVEALGPAMIVESASIVGAQTDFGMSGNLRDSVKPWQQLFARCSAVGPRTVLPDCPGHLGLRVVFVAAASKTAAHFDLGREIDLVVWPGSQTGEYLFWVLAENDEYFEAGLVVGWQSAMGVIADADVDEKVVGTELRVEGVEGVEGEVE